MAKERELDRMTFFTDRKDRTVINKVNIDIRVRDTADEDYAEWNNTSKDFTDPADIPPALKTMLQDFLNN